MEEETKIEGQVTGNPEEATPVEPAPEVAPEGAEPTPTGEDTPAE